MHYTTRFIAKHVRCRLFRCLVQNGQFLPPRLQTSQIPSKDQYQNTRAQILARMDVLMGGRAAEEILLGPEHVTTGASNDLEVRPRDSVV